MRACDSTASDARRLSALGAKRRMRSAPGSENPLKSAHEVPNERLRLDLLLDVNRHGADHQVSGVPLALAARLAAGRGRCCACSESSSAPALPSDTRVSSSAVGMFVRRASRCSKLSMSLVVVFATRAMFLSGLAGQEDYTLV